MFNQSFSLCTRIVNSEKGKNRNGNSSFQPEENETLIKINRFCFFPILSAQFNGISKILIIDFYARKYNSLGTRLTISNSVCYSPVSIAILKIARDASSKESDRSDIYRSRHIFPGRLSSSSHHKSVWNKAFLSQTFLVARLYQNNNSVQTPHH